LIIHVFARIITASYRPVERHNGGDRSVDFLGGFLFVCFDVARRIGADIYVVHHPAQNRVTAVGEFFFQGQFHQFLCQRGHIFEALTERYDRKAHAFKVLHHLHSAPAVEGNLADVVLCAELLDKALDEAVVYDVALSGLLEALLLLKVVVHMVVLDAQVHVVLRNPEEWQNAVFIVLVDRRKYQHKSRDIHGG